MPQHWHCQVRIATTPTPFIYRHLAVIMAFTFVFTFPLGFVATLKSAVIPCTAAICTSAVEGLQSFSVPVWGY